MHILVAEDNLINQKIMTRVLKDIGYTCDMVFNGKEVMTALEKQRYDFIFMDVNMPISNGYQNHP